MLDANASPGLDTIAFAIPGTGVHTLHPGDAFPVITDAVIIDGYTQPGASPNTLAVGDNAVLQIEIDCSAISVFNLSCFQFGGDGSTVRGLCINRANGFAFTVASFVLAADGNTIAGNFIGTDPTGSTYLAGANNDIFVLGAGNVIGGPNPADRNVIVAGSNGNERMITEDGGAHGTHVQGNYMGLNAAGTAALPGSGLSQAMFVGSASRGGDTIEDNVIIASDFAIKLDSGNNTIRDNLIGTNAAGTAALGSGLGIVVWWANSPTAPNNRITGNLISGNAVGIQIASTDTGLVIQGNKIGTDITGTAAIPNSGDGILIQGFFAPGGAIIGGTGPGEGNVIAFNGGAGVDVGINAVGAYTISGNSIFANGGLGIDLFDVTIQDPVTHVNPNDTGDGDPGPNNDQNFPVLTSATAGSSTTVSGTLNSAANTTFQIEFFANDAADSSGNGEGQTFLGFTTVTTDASGDANFTVSLPATVGATQVVSATATDPAGNTSEFSAVVPVTPGGNTDPVITALNGPVLGVRGQPLAYTGAFTDPDADTWTGTVNFGDGSGDQPLALNPDKTFAFNHAFATAGTFTVTVTVADNHGGVDTRTLDVNVAVAALESDPLDPAHPMLVVGGTTGNDLIVVLPAAAHGSLRIFVNHVPQGTFATAGRIVVFGQDGNDDIRVSGLISNSAWLFGGGGNDRLRGGRGNDVLLGGSGNDVLVAFSGRDLLIGGTGADRIVGNGGDDILLAGTTAFDSSDLALHAIQAEWTSARDAATRVANLKGVGSGPRDNGNIFLTTDGPSVTAFDDTSIDVLTGGGGADWFFAKLDTLLGDRITDLTARDFVSELIFI